MPSSPELLELWLPASVPRPYVHPAPVAGIHPAINAPPQPEPAQQELPLEGGLNEQCVYQFCAVSEK